jgi:phosphonate transport system substrate-binding protein
MARPRCWQHPTQRRAGVKTSGCFASAWWPNPARARPVEGAEAITAAYSKVLGMPVEIYVARDYADLIDAQTSGRIEYAAHTSLSYATAAMQCACITPLVAPVSDDGTEPAFAPC